MSSCPPVWSAFMRPRVYSPVPRCSRNVHKLSQTDTRLSPRGETRPKGLLMKPTVVLVHGAFAESASWDGVIDLLREADFPVVAAANPLRGLASDAAAVSDLVRSIDGPVVLVAHSY